ncbi:MAG: cob(I)yrinic acid a,c-diamide adenosyltransferase [Salibacteraceae bacterium]
MKIYTKKGDSGDTGILGGTRLPKNHLRIESYGTVDELNAFIGALRDALASDQHRSDLLKIQEELFTIGSQLASDPIKNKMKLPMIDGTEIRFLEKRMDDMDANLPEMKSFVLPGGHALVSQAHICRCVCRRAERHVVALSKNEVVNDLILQYLNRLSDYFFVLSRQLAMELDVDEIPWRPRPSS